MTSLFTKAAFAVLIGLGSIATVPSMAAARDVGVRVEVRDGYYHHRPRSHAPRACTNREAVWRAASSGMRGAYVIGRSPNRVILEGKRGYRLDRMVVANRPGCPIIRR
ncbi:hypothetical protein [Rhizobium sp. C1]|uniref:hypothetical protein n=1 Tax=Rhizobium sp. C1 TaxID=1349799 RepID=UPI001E5CA95F|nr:hypothetical protein [Rhizobium sp. C1]MCD2179126.1 hypothetical protein [Rhizobium sp. C1]